MIERFIEQLCRELELPAIDSKSKGVYVLPLEEDLSITISEANAVINFHSNIAALPSQGQDEFLEKMLLGNLFGQATYGAVLGLDEEGNSLLLQRTVDYPVEFRQFRDILEDFINAADFWRQEASPH